MIVSKRPGHRCFQRIDVKDPDIYCGCSEHYPMNNLEMLEKYVEEIKCTSK